MKKIVMLSLLFMIIILVMLKLKESSKNYICKDCNIILISLETLRNDNLPCYGYNKNTAPNICGFAKNSILFEKHYTQSPYSLPAHASLFTSLYPNQHNLNFIVKDVLSEEITTLAEVLKNNNYSTFWSAPLYNPHIPIDKGLERGFDFFENETQDDPIVSWEKTLESAKKHEKFFVFLHSFKIHEPHFPSNQDLISKFAEKTVEAIPTNWDQIRPRHMKNLKDNLENLQALLDEETRTHYKEIFDNPKGHEDEILNIILEKENKYEISQELKNKLDGIFRSTWESFIDINNPEHISFLKALYDTQIYEADMAFRNLVDYLSENNLLDNSIIIVYSPLGEMFNEHSTGLSHAKDLYELSINTPLIISAPGFRPQRLKQPVESIDIMPTLLDMLGIKAPKQLEGISLESLMLDPSEQMKNRPIVSELGGGTQAESILLGTWKLILNYDEGRPPQELYNLQEDPYETQNLINTYPEIVLELQQSLQTNKDKRKYFPKLDVEYPDWIDEEIKQRLIKKGYF